MWFAGDNGIDAPKPNVTSVKGGPAIVAVAREEEERLTIASGLDDGDATGVRLAVGSRGPSGGGGGGGGGIRALLGRGSSAPVRRRGGGPSAGAGAGAGRSGLRQPRAGRAGAASRASGSGSGSGAGAGSGSGSAPRARKPQRDSSGRGLPRSRVRRSMSDASEGPSSSPPAPAARHGSGRLSARSSASGASPRGGRDSRQSSSKEVGFGSGSAPRVPRVPSAGRRAPSGPGRRSAMSAGSARSSSRRGGGGGGGGAGGGGDSENERPGGDSPPKTGRSRGYTQKPSSRMDPHKARSPFSGPKGKTKFAASYASGRIPVRIDHFGTGRNRLQWDVPVDMVNYSELLPIAAEGIRESVHPHVFVARQMFKEMMAAGGARSKASSVVSALIRPLRLALMDAKSFSAALDAVNQLSKCVGPALDPHMGELCVQIAKKSFDPKLRDAVSRTLQAMEENGGPDAYSNIKKKVPTYTSVRI